MDKFYFFKEFPYQVYSCFLCGDWVLPDLKEKESALEAPAYLAMYLCVISHRRILSVSSLVTCAPGMTGPTGLGMLSLSVRPRLLLRGE